MTYEQKKAQAMGEIAVLLQPLVGSSWHLHEADNILTKLESIGMVFKDENQKLPEVRSHHELSICSHGCHVIEQNNMLKANFVKVLEAGK
jgi:hypothetical protein